MDAPDPAPRKPAGVQAVRWLVTLIPLAFVVHAVVAVRGMPAATVDTARMGLLALLLLSACVAVGLVIVGPARNRVAGLGLALVVAAFHLLAGPLRAWFSLFGGIG